MNFHRAAELPAGHRLYTSATSLEAWGTRGPHELREASELFATCGWHVTRPPADVSWNDYEPRRLRVFCRRLVGTPLAAYDPYRLHDLRKRWAVSSYFGWVRPSKDGDRHNIVIRRANDGPSAQWIAERNAAGFATTWALSGTRIERSLIGEASPLATTLQRIAEMLRIPVVAANNNEQNGDDGNTGNGVERVHNQGSFEPSIPVLLAALSDAFRPRIVTKKRRDGGKGRQRSINVRHAGAGRSFAEGNVLFGITDWRRHLVGLIFREGELVAYGDSAGRLRRPRYNAKIAKVLEDEETPTAKHIAAHSEENRTYLRLGGRDRYISNQRDDAPGPIAPAARTARAVANDNELRRAIANTAVMPEVTKMPDGIAREYGRISGIADLTGAGEGKTSAPRHEVLDELDRAELASEKIVGRDADIINAILDDESFRSIGLRFGYAASSAHKMGRRLVEKTLKSVSEKIAA